MSTPEQQVDFLLTPPCERGAEPGCMEQSSLDPLEQFHAMLCDHSGVSVLEEGEGEDEDEEGLRERLQQLYNVVVHRQQTQREDMEEVRCEEVKGELHVCVHCACVCLCGVLCTCVCCVRYVLCGVAVYGLVFTILQRCPSSGSL